MEMNECLSTVSKEARQRSVRQCNIEDTALEWYQHAIEIAIPNRGRYVSDAVVQNWKTKQGDYDIGIR